MLRCCAEPTCKVCWRSAPGSLVLLATYAIFLIYNRLDKMTRIWLYAAFAASRAAQPFVAVVAISVIGAVAIGAHVLSKWVPYYMHRQSGKGWPLRVCTSCRGCCSSYY